jgi:hypothetical protein
MSLSALAYRLFGIGAGGFLLSVAALIVLVVWPPNSEGARFAIGTAAVAIMVQSLAWAFSVSHWIRCERTQSLLSATILEQLVQSDGLPSEPAGASSHRARHSPTGTGVSARGVLAWSETLSVRLPPKDRASAVNRIWQFRLSLEIGPASMTADGDGLAIIVEKLNGSPRRPVHYGVRGFWDHDDGREVYLRFAFGPALVFGVMWGWSALICAVIALICGQLWDEAEAGLGDLPIVWAALLAVASAIALTYHYLVVARERRAAVNRRALVSAWETMGQEAR